MKEETRVIIDTGMLGWLAYVEADPRIYGMGNTVEAAVKALKRAYPSLKNIKVVGPGE